MTDQPLTPDDITVTPSGVLLSADPDTWRRTDGPTLEPFATHIDGHEVLAEIIDGAITFTPDTEGEWLLGMRPVTTPTPPRVLDSDTPREVGNKP